MKKSVLAVIFTVVGLLYFVGLATNAHAGGDKVRGDEAEGPANQLGECPFTG